MLDMYKHPWP